MLSIWFSWERNPGPNGTASTSSSVFSVSISNVIVPLDALFYMSDRIASYRHLKGISMKEQLARLPTKKLRVV